MQKQSSKQIDDRLKEQLKSKYQVIIYPDDDIQHSENFTPFVIMDDRIFKKHPKYKSIKLNEQGGMDTPVETPKHHKHEFKKPKNIMDIIKLKSKIDKKSESEVKTKGGKLWDKFKSKLEDGEEAF